MTLAEINAALATAEQTVADLRKVRNEALLAACPYKAGDIVKTAGNEYRVSKLVPSPRKNLVFLECQYMTSAKRWSQGYRTVEHYIEG